MDLPPNLTESEVLEAIEKAVRILAPSFVFGYFDRDDIEQEARLLGLQALSKYDGVRPLANFLYSCILSRLINFKRNKFRRNDPPCSRCHTGDPCGATICRKYAEWLARNNTKANLMRPMALQSVADEREEHTRYESTVEQEAEIAELLQRIDTRLPVELRSYYLQMRDGVSIPRAKRQLVMDAVREILKGDVQCPPSEDD